MKDELTFTVEGEPRACARPRFTVVKGKPRAYKHKDDADFQRFVTTSARNAMLKQNRRDLFRGPLSVYIRFNYPALKSRRAGLRGATLPKTSKPDLDNLAKSILDAMNEIVFRDDAQVSRLEVEKFRLPTGEPAQTVVRVSSIQ